MAAKPKGRKKAKAGTGKKSTAKSASESARPLDVTKMIGGNDLRNLVKRFRSARDDAKDAGKGARDALAEKIKKKLVDPRAFKILCGLMDINKDHQLATTLAFLDYGRDVLGLDERATRQAEMFPAKVGAAEPAQTDIEDDKRDLRPPFMRTDEAPTEPEKLN